MCKSCLTNKDVIGLIDYYKTNGIITMKKHVKVNHYTLFNIYAKDVYNHLNVHLNENQQLTSHT